MANGEHIEVAKAYVTIVPSLEGSQQTIATELGAIASPASKEVGEQSGKDFGDALATGLKAAAGVIAAAMTAVVGAAVAAGKAFIDTANEVGELGNEIDKNSQKMQMSISGYQTWSFVLEHAGANIDGMKTAMKKLTVAAEEGNDAFMALGISQADLANMSPEETWNATITALQQVSDEGERTALASELLGKGAVELAPLFNMTAEETEALKDQVVELGGIMSDDAVKAAAEYEDQMQNMQVALTGVRNNMMAKFLPGMSQVMKGLSMVFSGQGGIEEIRAGLDEIVANIAALSPEFFEIAQTIVFSVLEGFAPMLPTVVETVFSFVNQALTTITGMIPQLLPIITMALTSLMSTVFSCLPIITSSLLTLITDLVTWLASGNNVKLFANGIVQLVSTIASQLAMVLPILVPALVQIVSSLAQALIAPENIEVLVNAVLLLVGAIFVALVNTVPELINFVTGVITELGTLLGNFFIWAVPLVAQGIAAIVNTVSSWGNNIKNYVTGLVSGIQSTVQSWGNSIKSFVIGLITGIQSAIYNWIINIQNGFINGFNAVQQWVSSIISNIQGFVNTCISVLAGLPGEVVSIGENLVKGLWEGIDDKVDWVCEKIKGMGKQIEKAIKKVFGIASPSKVFAEIGDYLAQGLGVGFEDGMDGVQDDMVGQMEDLTGTMSADITATGTEGAATLGDTTTINGGAISINVYGAEGQNVNELAEVIAEKLEDMTRRKGAVYA